MLSNLPKLVSRVKVVRERVNVSFFHIFWDCEFLVFPHCECEVVLIKFVMLHDRFVICAFLENFRSMNQCKHPRIKKIEEKKYYVASEGLYGRIYAPSFLHFCQDCPLWLFSQVLSGPWHVHVSSTRMEMEFSFCPKIQYFFWHLHWP